MLPAHTSPVYCTFQDRPVRSAAAALFFIDQIDKLIEKVHRRGQFSHEREKEKTIDLFRKGQDIYRKMVEGPQTEAVPVQSGYYSR